MDELYERQEDILRSLLQLQRLGSIGDESNRLVNEIQIQSAELGAMVRRASGISEAEWVVYLRKRA